MFLGGKCKYVLRKLCSDEQITKKKAVQQNCLPNFTDVAELNCALCCWDACRGIFKLFIIF